jgi:hypothetical protein
LGFIQSSWSNIIVLGNEDWSLATIAAAGAWRREIFVAKEYSQTAYKSRPPHQPKLGW